MPHLFISYSRKDSYHRDSLITVLKNASIPFWADIELEAGESWREEIDNALEDSFAIAVIVTPYSMRSQYVTYEWSWAIGHDIPVMPLLFGEFPNDLIHSRLAALQLLRCYPEIPDASLQTIKRYQKGSYVALFIERHVSEMLMPLRFIMRILAWLYSNDDFEMEEDIYSTAVVSLFKELSELNKDKLPQLWIQTYHAFPTEQKRKFQRLTEQLSDLGDPFLKLYSEPENLFVANILLSKWEKDIDSLLREFYGYSNLHYEELDDALKEISEGSLSLEDNKTRVKIFMIGLKLASVQLPMATLQNIEKIFEIVSGHSYTMLRMGPREDDIGEPPDEFDE